MNAEPAVTLIIPAHNEAQRLWSTLHVYHTAFAKAFGSDFELLVVCNGCTDETAALATLYQRSAPQVRVVVIEEAVGKGGAILEGFRVATGAQVVFADADAATESASLLKLLADLADYDVVIGSRRLAGSVIVRPQTQLRRVFGTAFHVSTRLLFNLPFYDTQCGAKAFRKRAAVLLSEAVSETKWTFDVDLLLSARRLGLTVVERPVVWTDIPGSRLKVGPTTVQVLRSFWAMKQKTAAPQGAPSFRSPVSPVASPTVLATAPVAPGGMRDELERVGAK